MYDAEIGFGRYKPDPPIIYDHSFGKTGVGKQEFIISELKEGIEKAITAYIKVNYNL